MATSTSRGGLRQAAVPGPLAAAWIALVTRWGLTPQLPAVPIDSIVLQPTLTDANVVNLGLNDAAIWRQWLSTAAYLNATVGALDALKAATSFWEGAKTAFNNTLYSGVICPSDAQLADIAKISSLGGRK